MIAVALALTAVATPAPVVSTEAGRVRGEALPGGGGVFRGIRFAAPPTGPLRWRPPLPAKRWQGVADATEPHAACPQPSYGSWNQAAADSSAEDCLFLDVRTPRIDPAAKLPVLVWIHGGGNRGGAGGGTVESHITDAGIVLVSIQYRLGALGFLSHPALTAEQGGASGNYGLMDQQAALRWVQANIARFGGDPAQVTIAGESAGAQDVGLHMLAPGSRTLFARAIAESGTPGFGVPPRTLAENERVGAAIARKAALPAKASAAQLRALPVAAILQAQETVEAPGVEDNSFIWLHAVVDGRVLRETPAETLAAGRFARAPFLIGVNAQEFTGYSGRDSEPVIAREFPRNTAAVRAAYGLDRTPAPAPDPRLGDVAMQLGTDLVFRCPTIAVSKALRARGNPVWQYQFDYAPAGETVNHASETRYVFDLPKPGQPPLQAYWLNFVRRSDPNGPGLPHWPAYDLASRPYLEFAQTGPVARTDLRGTVCAPRTTP
ncbi:carboxylesterase/lipase family protein [Sphingomonas sp. ac-8]|uniref:carboxylesterase/lipase family protein n=1 Tax=Sphingomonas sp. ac-8 TaxID=3242977 RepID=UPI003A809AA3